MLSAAEYQQMPFTELHERLCEALRGDRPPWRQQVVHPDGRVETIFVDGSVEWSKAEPKTMGAPLSKKDVLPLLAAAPPLLKLPARWLQMDYDKDADVLYLTFRRPRNIGDSEELDNGVIVHTDGDDVVGLTILDASTRA